MLPILLAQAEQTVEAMPTVDWSAIPSSADAAAAAALGTGAVALGVGMMIFIAIASLIGLIFLIWWIVLIIDLSKREFPQKSTYMILMILSLFLGFMWLMDLIYYFAIVKNNVGTKKA
jgi:Kef-type K+ transport system membrane component KefB